MQIVHKGIMGQAGGGMKGRHRPLLPSAAMVLAVRNYGKDREGKKEIGLFAFRCTGECVCAYDEVDNEVP